MSGAINSFFELIQENTMFVFIVVSLIILVIFCSLAIIFAKMKQKFWKALIPVYNVMFIMDLLNIPIWMVLVILIPFVNMIGIPLMFLIIGWKLGNYCHKNMFMTIGLMICPPLFYPILAATEIDLENKGKKILAPEKLPDSFSLDAVEIENVGSWLKAMSLEDEKTIEKMMPRTRKVTNVSSPKKTAKKDFYSVPTPTNNYEVEDLSVALPTADDLTFDYNSLYQIDTTNDKIVPAPTPKEIVEPEEVQKEIIEDFHVQEENEVLPMIHDITLEEAKPITGELEPILINKRDEFKKIEPVQIKEEILSPSEFILKPKKSKQEEEQNNNTKRESVNTILTTATPNSIDIPITSIQDISNQIGIPATFDNSMQSKYDISMDEKTNIDLGIAAPTVDEQQDIEESGLDGPTLAASPFEEELPENIEFSEEMAPINKSDDKSKSIVEEYKAPEIEPGTRIDQIVSMNIVEPEKLPVGVLVTEEPKQENISEMASVPNSTIPNNINQVSTNMAPVNNENVRMDTRQNFIPNNVPIVPKVENIPPQSNQQVRIQPMPAEQQTIDPNFIQQHPTAIFQLGLSSGQSLLRAVDNKPIPPTFVPSTTGEKNCPVCGVKLRQDCPTCFMCGFKF